MNQLPLHSPIRVHPFSGLVIDVDTWATAHDYHRQHQQLHLLSLHGTGVAQGLDVVSTDPPSESVVVEAGLAIDSFGNTIIVPERQYVVLGNQAGLTYLVLDYVEGIPPSDGNNRDTRARVKEDFRLRAVQTTPEPHSIELARVEMKKGAAPIVGAANPWLPKDSELDLRHRPRLHVTAPKVIKVGLVVHGDEASLSASHLAGFQFLLREMEYCGLRAEVTKTTDAAVPDADLLYVTADSGATVPSAMVKRLGERVAEGAWMFVDPCGSDTSMLESFRTLVKPKTGSATEDLMLGSRFVFGTPPEGAFPTRNMTWGERVTLSPRDYGCAWAGRRGDHAFQRDVVRAALEFGVNAAFCVGHSGVGPETEPRRSRGAGGSNPAADKPDAEAESKEEAQAAAES
ncbi:MAG TPA: hypothetical protein VFS30_11720 [Dehalococcoidia bacterium]|nr:hypothetical protein [Dehalococcoidia bacterium]